MYRADRWGSADKKESQPEIFPKPPSPRDGLQTMQSPLYTEYSIPAESSEVKKKKI